MKKAINHEKTFENSFCQRTPFEVSLSAHFFNREADNIIQKSEDEKLIYGNFSLNFQKLPDLRDHTAQLTGICNVLRKLSSLNEQKRKVLSLRT